MTLFPRSGPYDSKDKAVQDRLKDFWSDTISINQVFWAEADLDARFEAGDQSVFYELYDVTGSRNNFTFNQIKRVTNMITGHQRRNRKSIIVIPVENADEQTADQFTKIISWCNQQENTLQTISEAFNGAIVSGLSLLHVWMDYRNDPESGNIRVDNCSYNSFLLDPFFRKKDLSDCNVVWKRSYISPQVAMSLMPKNKREIKEMSGFDAHDGKFLYMPENFNLQKGTLLAYDEFYYRTFRKQKLLVDSQTGEVQEWNGQDDSQLKRFLTAYPQITVIEKDVPTVNLSILVNGKVLYDGKNPSGTDRYPFVPVFGYFNPQLPSFSARIQGVVRGLRDAQFLYNRRKAIELDIAESKATTGWIAKEGAVIDPRELFKTGQGRTIMLKKGAQMSDILPIPTQDVPQSFFQLSQNLSQEIMQISGVNEELLGAAMDDKAGILSMLRQGAGLTTLMTLFDQLDLSQKLLGQLMLDMIQSNFTPGKVKRIIEDEPTPQFYNKAFGRYDAAVEEGLNTTTQRQMQFAQLLELKQVGVPVPDDVLIKAATIQNKKELTEAIEASNRQAAQAQEMQLQAALQEQAARTNLANARSQADIGLAEERLSRIPENRALAIERLAEANSDRERATLDKIRAIKELEDIDLSQLQRLLQLAQELKAFEGVDEQSQSKQSTTQGALDQISF